VIASAKTVWYLTRGTGAVALVLLTTVTVLGVLNAVRWSPPRTPRFVLQRIHRNLSLLAVAFIAVHIATAVIDGFAGIRWIDAVVPFVSTYRPLWLGLGAVAFDLVIAIALTSLLRGHLNYVAWRVVHWMSYALWGVALFHALGTGSDASRPWMLGLVAISVGAVAAAAAWRIASGWREWAPGRIALAMGSVAFPLALAVWFVSGPEQPGWAARAGTPAHLLPHASAARTSAPTTVPKAATPKPLVLPPTADVSGVTRLHRRQGGLATVDISLSSRGSPPLSIAVVLHGTAEGEGISMRDGSVTFTPPHGAAPYEGTVTGLEGGQINASVSDGHGDDMDLSLSLQISSGGQTTGQMALRGTSNGSTAA
jgi:sulfoxide reductase heme-binding subunit YedZ